VEVEDLAVPAGAGARVELRILRPAAAEGALPVVLYLRGDGARGGDRRVDDLPARELAAGLGAAVVVPAPGAQAAEHRGELEHAYAILCWVGREGGRRGLDGERIVLAGDAAGESLCAELARLAERRGGPPLLAQALRPAADRTPIEQLLGLPRALVTVAPAERRSSG
jgi:acetyl esterase/lipase